LIYLEQAAWSSLRSATGFFRDLAQRAGVALGAYDECMASTKHAGRIEASAQEGAKLGVGSTPTFLINGRLYPGVFSSDSLASLVRSLLAKPAP
jgi:protein-disulfide isomerase